MFHIFLYLILFDFILVAWNISIKTDVHENTVENTVEDVHEKQQEVHENTGEDTVEEAHEKQQEVLENSVEETVSLDKCLSKFGE